MKAKRILIIAGNMGSGKSTLCQRLEERVGWKWLAMDNFRREVQANDFQQEQQAIDQFLHAVLHTQYAIVETTTFGRSYPILMALIRKHQVQYDLIKMICSPEQCHRRLMHRNSLPTFPKRYKLWESLWSMHEHLKGIKADFLLSSEKYTSEVMATMIINQVLHEETASK